MAFPDRPAAPTAGVASMFRRPALICLTSQRRTRVLDYIPLDGVDAEADSVAAAPFLTSAY